MKKYLSNYIKYIDNIINNDNSKINEKLINFHCQQILFFQHERIVHLVVLFLVSILLVISVAVYACFDLIGFLLLSFAFLCLLIPYINHYYFLENGVQKLYYYYNDLNKIYYKIEMNNLKGDVSEKE